MKTNNRFGRAGSAASILSLLPFFCLFFFAVPPQACADETTPVRIVYSSITASQSVAWVALDSGIYKKYGLDVDLIFVSSGSKAISTLLAGSVPILFTAGSPVVGADLGGADARVIAGLLNVFPYYVIGGRTVTQAQQLRGAKIGISRFGSSGHAATVYAMRKLGLEPGRDVTLLQVGGGRERFAAMESGAIQGTLLTPPEELIAKKAGFHVIADVSQLGIPFLHSAVVTRRRTIEARPELVGHFVAAVVDGLHFIKTHRDETLKLFAKYFRTRDMEALADAYDDYVRKAPRLPLTQPRAVETVLQIVGKERPEALKAKPEEFIDNSFVEKLRDSGFVDRLYGQ